MTKIDTQATSKAKPLTLEDRLQPWIDQGEYIIVLVITLMAWAGGWVNLIAFESWNASIFGRYSLPFFALLIAYTLGFGLFFWLIGSLRALERFKHLIAFIQRTPLLYAAIWLGFAVLIWSMTAFDLWRAFPLLQGALLLIIVLFTGLVLLTQPDANAPFQRWRKLALAAIGALVLLELSLQGLAQVGAYPATLDDGIRVPYARMYQNGDVLVNDATNQFGWFYQNFRLEPDEQRIILLGDTYIEALQVPRTEHLGVQLEVLLNADDAEATEVIAHGMGGFGTYNYLSNLYWPFLWEPVTPSDFIVFVQPANDLDFALTAETPPSEEDITDDGLPYLIQPHASFGEWHQLAHEVVKGYDPLNLLQVLYHQSMTWNWLNTLPATEPAPFATTRPTLANSADAPFGPATFLYDGSEAERADRVYSEFADQLRVFADFVREQGSEVHLVTIPHFPAGFYEVNAGDGRQATFEAYNLLAPDQRVAAIGSDLGLTTLTLGETWQVNITVDELRAYFTENGTGHFSVAGHAAVAQLLYQCFYTDDTPVGCHTGE